MGGAEGGSRACPFPLSRFKRFSIVCSRSERSIRSAEWSKGTFLLISVKWFVSLVPLGLGLTFWAPGRGAAGDSGVTKRSAMNRTDAAAFPFLVNEPVARRIGEIFAESFERA